MSILLDNYEDLISVAEFAKILGIKKRQAYNIINSENFRIFNPTGTNVVSFTDVAQGSWYYDFVRRASAAGIINGYDGIFNPEGNITRQDASLMVFRVLNSLNKLPSGTASFKDDKNIAWKLV